MSEKYTTEFVSADSVLAKLESVPGLQGDLTQRREASEQMEREYQAGLAQIRDLARLTQAEVAEKMGKSQTGISRLEHQHDMLLSTLKSYLEAVGAEATINVRVGGQGHEHYLTFDLRELV